MLMKLTTGGAKSTFNLLDDKNLYSENRTRKMCPIIYFIPPGTFTSSNEWF